MTQNGRIRKIIIIGAGTIGSYIAHILQREQQVDVVLIDNDRRRLNEAAETYDIQTLFGNGANPRILDKAGVRDTQLVLALTNSSEVNLLAATIAKRMGAGKVVARTRAPWSIDTSLIDLRACLDIDLLLNPELLTAIEIVKFLENPEALAMTTYARGKVQLRQFVLDEQSPFAGKALKDCRIPPGVLVVMRARGSEVVIPGGETTLEAGDRLTIVGLPDRMPDAQKLFHAPSEPLRHITIAGGGNSGRFLAQTLEERNFDVRLIDTDPERCEYLSERLKRTTVIRGDATRKGFMQEERIDSSDIFIAVMGDDEDNLMASLLAKELGIKQTVARVERPDYANLVQKMGVDLALSPRHIMADHVMTLISGGRIKAVSLMEEGKVEVIEFQAEQGAPITGAPLSEIGMPKGALVSSIVRYGSAIIPRGDTEILPGDTVIVVGLSERMDQVERMFEAT